MELELNNSNWKEEMPKQIKDGNTLLYDVAINYLTRSVDGRTGLVNSLVMAFLPSLKKKKKSTIYIIKI